MNVLFLSYWGISEGLTSATVIPHLQILNDFEIIDKIIFCSIERDGNTESFMLPDKVSHVALQSGKSIIDKFNDFAHLPKKN